MPLVPAPLLPRLPSRPRGARGFTLIELLVTIAIAAILSTVAGPAMTRVIAANRVQTEASGLVNDLQLARAEAVKRGQPVTVCPSSDGATCLGANTWHSGWILFSDVNGNATVDSATDTVLRKRAAFKGGDTFVASPSAAAVTFNREGFTSNLGTSVVTFKLHAAGGDAKATRCVAVSIGGRLTNQANGEGSCS